MTDCSHWHGKFFIPLYFMMLLSFSLMIVASFPTRLNVCSVCTVYVYRWVNVCNHSEEMDIPFLRREGN